MPIVLNSLIASILDARAHGTFVPSENDVPADTVIAFIASMKVKKGETRDINVATIRNILAEAHITLTPDDLCQVIGELVGRGVLHPVPQIIDGEECHFLAEGEDYTALSALLTGREPCVGPTTGSTLHHTQIFLTYSVDPKNIMEENNTTNGTDEVAPSKPKLLARVDLKIVLTLIGLILFLYWCSVHIKIDVSMS